MIGDHSLLACPFCGGEGLLDSYAEDNGDARYTIRCRSCACEGPWAKSAGGAARWWNYRKDELVTDTSSSSTECRTLCGTCKHWDHGNYLGAELPGRPFHRIVLCKWGEGLKLPEWCEGLKGHRFTNEAGTTERGCPTWSPIETLKP